MRRKSLWPILGVVLLWVGGADAADLDRLLHGDYAITGAATCLISASGFNPDLTPKGPSNVSSFNVQGVITFNGDGTGTEQARNVVVIHSILPSGTPSVRSDEFTTPFTYTVAPDRTFTLLFGPIEGTELTGTRAGQTFTIPSVPAVGLIAKGGKSATLATDTPNVEVITFSTGERFPRICQRSRVLLKIGEREDD